MSKVDQIESHFHVKVTPINDDAGDLNDIEYIDSEKAAVPHLEICSTARKPFNHRPRQTSIKIHSDWFIIAAHPKFKLEYKSFIRNSFLNCTLLLTYLFTI